MAGRPRAPTTLVNDILLPNEIVNDNITLFNLLPAIHNDNLTVLQWLARRRLVSNNVDCSVCREPCTLNRYAQGLDGWRWRCNRDNFCQSVRHNTFFQRSHLQLNHLVFLLYMWCYDYPQTQMIRETGVAEPTIIDWCNFIREICEEYLEANPQQLGGFDHNGEPIIVEIDESKYFHRKYHRGQWREGHWVFGAIERHSGRCCLIEVPNRRGDTLLPIIQQWILPGSRIISDGWAAYANINQIGGGIYVHDVIVHERNFVDPNDPSVHTQMIENTWMRAKKKLRRQHGTSAALFESYIAEFLWRQRVGANKFGEMMNCIREIYVV